MSLRPPCSIEGCQKPVKAYSLCPMHATRFERHGDPLKVKREISREWPSVCTFDGCEKKSEARGYCTKHYTRMKRHGDPGAIKKTGVPKGRNAIWRADGIGYSGAHMRVRGERGKASEHECVDCGGTAEQWSYDHRCMDERTQEVNGFTLPYSLDIDHYEPRCVVCHLVFDSVIPPPPPHQPDRAPDIQRRGLQSSKEA